MIEAYPSNLLANRQLGGSLGRFWHLSSPVSPCARLAMELSVTLSGGDGG
jgi:hypothetical protein